MVKNIYEIEVNYADKKSIKSAEKKKEIYENKGLNLYETKQTGTDKFVLKYKSNTNITPKSYLRDNESKF